MSIDSLVELADTGVWGPESSSGIGVVRSTNFRNSGELDLSEVAFREIEEKKVGKKLLRPGDILLERSGGGPKQPVGRVAWFDSEGEFVFGNFIQRLRADNRVVYAKFLFYLLYWFHQSGKTEQLQQYTTGIRNLNFKEYMSTELPIPPLPEQRKIAAILTSVDDAIAATQRIIDQTERVKRGLMQQLLTRGIGHTKFKKTEIGEIPEEWEVVMLRDVVTHLFRGKSPRYVDYSNLKVINQKCIYWDGFKEQNVKYVDETTITLWDDKYFVRKSDVLLNSTGTGTIGRAVLFPFESNEYVIDSHVTCIRTNQSKLLPAFLKYYLEFEENQRRLALTCFTGSTNQIELSKSQLLSFKLALPSMWEQRSINNVLDSIQGKIAIENQYKSSLQVLKASLMHVLLTGKVRVKVEEKAEAVV